MIDKPSNAIEVLDGQGYIALVNQMGTEVTAVNAARVSFGKIKEEMDDKDVKLLKYLIENRHTSPLEHIQFTFLVHCPLFIARQWMRHRTWKYNEISRRYTEENIEIYEPQFYRTQHQSDRQASDDQICLMNHEVSEMTGRVHRHCIQAYEIMLGYGICREQARGVLPQNMMTTFWATCDLHNLLHFLSLRDDAHAQKEIVEYAQAIKKLIAPSIPTIAGDWK